MCNKLKNYWLLSPGIPVFAFFTIWKKNVRLDMYALLNCQSLTVSLDIFSRRGYWQACITRRWLRCNVRCNFCMRKKWICEVWDKILMKTRSIGFQKWS